MRMTPVKCLMVAIALLVIGAPGCSSSRGPADATRVIVFVPGVAGDGPWYGGLKCALVESGASTRVETFGWGAPGPLFALNFNSQSIHESAETKLARQLQSHPGQRICLVAHSAGCGVVLGALKRLDGSSPIGPVILLAPSVSPTYDLAPAIAQITGDLHVFYSPHDTLFLSWRTSTFGTYDNVKSRAAGNVGFDMSQLSPDAAGRVVQHAYDPAWRELGNDGSHGGMLAQRCAQQVVAPLLLAPDPTRGSPVSPCAAIRP